MKCAGCGAQVDYLDHACSPNQLMRMRCGIVEHFQTQASVSVYNQHTYDVPPPLQILCMHGGIGRCIHKIEQIAAIQRPVTMEEGGPVLMDLLWSDPTTNDAVVGVQPSPRGPGLVTFGPDRVKEFCKVGGSWHGTCVSISQRPGDREIKAISRHSHH